MLSTDPAFKLFGALAKSRAGCFDVPMTTDRKKAMQRLRTHALAFPGAWEDFPWGESVAKVGKKVFVFLGRGDEKGPTGISTKLPDSADAALHFPFATPTGYGLGKAGWVSSSFEPGDEIPVELLCDWIGESYRAVAPKSLVTKAGGGESTPVKKAPKRKAPAKTAAVKKPAPKKRVSKKK